MKKIIFNLVSILSLFFPKRKNWWAFGCWSGKLFCDNSKYFFDYVSKNKQQIKAMWFTKNKDLYHRLKRNHIKCYYVYSIWSLIKLFQCKVFIETSGYNDISFYIPRRTIEIQLWHGTGFKKVGKEDYTFDGRDNYNFLRKKRIATFDRSYWMVSSKENIDKYSKSFDTPQNNFFITGQPKDDEYYYNQNKKKNKIEEIIKAKKYNKVFCYLPTHRHFGKGKLNNPLLDKNIFKNLNQMLAKNDSYLIIKPHFNDYEKFEKNSISGTKHIVLLDNFKEMDVFEYLPACDCLITDYSGVYFSFLHSHKPIILFQYDFDEYIKGDMGLIDDFYNFVGNQSCRTVEELFKRIDNVIDGSDENKIDREKIFKKYFVFSDGKSKERIFDKIMSIL